MSEILVVKLGGTSLASAARFRLAARRLRAHARAGHRVVAVVSAAGGATDRIARLLAAVSLGRPHPREADRALATGEDLSAALLASALAALGVPSHSLRGGEAGVRVEGGFCGGRIERVDPAPLRTLLDAGIIPIVSGFQGARVDGETVTLGRGASDLSAVAIAAELGPAECHIVTDVDGVFDRDPHVDPAARFFPRLTHGELVRLAEAGAKVVHPEAAREAQRAGVPLRIHHFRAPLDGGRGTVVTATPRRPPAAEIPARESAKADFGPSLPRIHPPVLPIPLHPAATEVTA